MSNHAYARLSGSRRSALDADANAELDGAFESDDEDHQLESTPLTQFHPPERTSSRGASAAYDFERDYDYPPPGSPPRPSALALPNSHGNTNGALPSPAAVQNAPPAAGLRRWGPYFIRRAVGAILPTHYVRVPDNEAGPALSGPRRGGGMENDGVFANVMAKPAPPRTAVDENGEVYVMPEETQKDVPPSYAAAQADAVPPYWETTIHAPHLGVDDDMIIEGLPSGSLFAFAWNFLISMTFQFVGFMITYVLHTSHAAKYGSRAGLGITLIQYGLYSHPESNDVVGGDGELIGGSGNIASLFRRGTTFAFPRTVTPLLSTSPTNGTQEDTGGFGLRGFISTDWLSFLLMTAGWFLLLSSLLGFARVKRWEHSIRTSSRPPPTPTPEALARDLAVRQHIGNAFGFEVEDYYEEGERADEEVRRTRQASSGDRGMHQNLPAVGLI